MADDDDTEKWFEDEPVYGELKEALEMLYDQGAPPPDEWESFNVDINYDASKVEVAVVASDGYEYSITETIPDLADFGIDSWVWSAWDWIEDEYPDVDRDSTYSD